MLTDNRPGGDEKRRHKKFHTAVTFVAVLLSAFTHSAGVSWPLTIAFETGQSLWWLQCLALSVLVSVLHGRRTWQQAAGVGLLFATAWLCATFWWLYISMHIYAGLNSIITALAIVSLAAALGLYYAAACALYWYLKPSKPWMASLLFAALWTMAEMARGTWLTGFGWGATGYAHVDGPLASYIPWIGAYGVGALAAWVAAGVIQLVQGGMGLRLALAVVVGGGLLLPLTQLQWSQAAGDLSVTLLQGNIPQDEKFQSGSGIPLALRWYGDELNRSSTELIVAPETALPVLPQELPGGYWDGLVTRFAKQDQAALVGSPWGNMHDGYTNSVFAFGPNQKQEWRYDKHHLVPFGEFIPPLFKWFTRMMNIPLGDFNRGAVGQASYPWKGQRLALNICYEDLFGEELGVRFMDPASAPTMFVNVSNIGWFGDSIAIDQHLQISRMRALEFERPMLRATNTGATVIIDHTGRVTHSLPRWTRGVLVGDAQGRSGNTPFAWWVARFGLWPIWITALAIVLGATYVRRTRAV
jgi:apolipoprotein N-acyltransferase